MICVRHEDDMAREDEAVPPQHDSLGPHGAGKCDVLRLHCLQLRRAECSVALTFAHSAMSVLFCDYVWSG